MGPAVYLTLTGRAREAVRDLKPADIGKETGLDEIIVKLDAVYLKDENTHAYVAFKEFYEFKRASGENFSELHSIPVDKQSRRQLQFIFEGKLYQFKVLVFGLSTAPRIFTNVMKPVVAFI